MSFGCVKTSTSEVICQLVTNQAGCVLSPQKSCTANVSRLHRGRVSEPKLEFVGLACGCRKANQKRLSVILVMAFVNSSYRKRYIEIMKTTTNARQLLKTVITSTDDFGFSSNTLSDTRYVLEAMLDVLRSGSGCDEDVDATEIAILLCDRFERRMTELENKSSR